MYTLPFTISHGLMGFQRLVLKPVGHVWPKAVDSVIKGFFWLSEKSKEKGQAQVAPFYAVGFMLM